VVCAIGAALSSVSFASCGAVSSLSLSDTLFASILVSRLFGSESVVGESGVSSDTDTVVMVGTVFVFDRNQFISVECLLCNGGSSAGLVVQKDVVKLC
jgi:hypothetical protein